MFNSVLTNMTVYSLDHYDRIIDDLKIEQVQMAFEKDNQLKKLALQCEGYLKDVQTQTELKNDLIIRNRDLQAQVKKSSRAE